MRYQDHADEQGTRPARSFSGKVLFRNIGVGAETPRRRLAWHSWMSNRRALPDAWDAWYKQIEHVHRVFPREERPKPEQLKGLLSRESRAKDRYDAARLALLGLDESGAGPPADPDANPFK